MRKIIAMILLVVLAMILPTLTMAKEFKSQGIFQVATEFVPGLAERSLVYAERVYQVIGNGKAMQLQVISFNDPIRPSLDVALNFNANRIIGLVANNNLVFIGVEVETGDNEVVVVNIENEANPIIVSRIPVRLGITSLAVRKKSLLVMSRSLIASYDMSMPNRPRVTGQAKEIFGGYIDMAVADSWVGVLHRPAGGVAKLLVYKFNGEVFTKVGAGEVSQFAEKLYAVANFSEQQFVALGAATQTGKTRWYYDVYAVAPFGDLKPVSIPALAKQSDLSVVYATTENELRLFLVTREAFMQRSTGKVKSSNQLHVLECANKAWQNFNQSKLAVDQPLLMQLSGRQLRVYGLDLMDQPVVEIFDF